MAKAKKVETAKTELATRRSGYKRKSNKRVDVLGAQLKRVARKAIKAANYKTKEERALIAEEKRKISLELYRKNKK